MTGVCLPALTGDTLVIKYKLMTKTFIKYNLPLDHFIMLYELVSSVGSVVN